jgi:hypothetical protein
MTETAIVTTTPMQLIDNAVAKGVDTDQLEKLLALQERWEANEARKAYSNSMVDVHAEIPVIAKALRNNQTNSNYADLGAVIEQTKKIYTKHGFSIVFHEGKADEPEFVRILADVIHRSGHKEVYYYDAPMEGKGIKGNVNMTATHGKASSTSYARRYLMYMIFNIPTGDDDGNSAGQGDTLSETQIAEVEALAQEVGVDVKGKAFLSYLKVDTLDDVLSKNFKAVIAVLEKKRK